MTNLRSPHPTHGRVLGLALALAASALVQAQPAPAEPRVVTVDCDAGESLQSALTEHGAGTTL